MDTQVDIANRLVRFIDNLPNEGGSTLVILKGHLLLEEIITEILKVKLKDNPLNLKVSDKWMYAKKLEMFWALVQGEFDGKFWGALKEINTIRNKMAHALEPNGIDERIQNFIDSFKDHPLYIASKHDSLNLQYSIACLYILLNSYLNRIKKI